MMGILSGAMTVRRFRIVGDVDEGWREKFRDGLQDNAFIEPPEGLAKEEVEGWVQTHNLLDTDFSDFNRWLYNDFLLFSLRVDKKRLPAKLFAAHLAKACEAWCREHDTVRCPASVKSEIKDRMEADWLKKTLPRVSVTEACWNVNQRYMVLHSLSEPVAERFRKRFFRTFGLKMIPWGPLDWLEDRGAVEALLGTVPTQVGVHG